MTTTTTTSDGLLHADWFNDQGQVLCGKNKDDVTTVERDDEVTCPECRKDLDEMASAIKLDF